MGRKKKKKKAAARRRREEQEDERKASTSAMAVAAADSEEEITAASSSTTLLPPNPPLPAPFMVAPVGLRNLGNTCFFNSVMQCLYGISELRRADLSKGRVSKALGMFFRMYDDSSRRHCKGDRRDYVDTFHAGSAASGTKKTKKTKKSKKKDKTKAKKHSLRQPRSGTISPLGLLNEIRKKAPWLKGFRQQDAHELLRFLIDIVDTEQKKHALRRTKQCNVTSLDGVVDSGDRKTRKEAAANVTSSTESGTIITNVFGAVLASHVTCATCGYISERLERCSDVSLEIPAPMQKRGRKKKSNNKDGAQCLQNGELQPLSTGRGSKSQRKKARRKVKQQDSRADTEGRKHESSLVNIVSSDGDESGKGNDMSRQGLSGKGTKAQRKKAAKERRAARLRARMEAEELEFLEQSPGGDRNIQEMPETDISAHVRTDGDQKKAEKTFTPEEQAETLEKVSTSHLTLASATRNAFAPASPGACSSTEPPIPPHVEIELFVSELIDAVQSDSLDSVASCRTAPTKNATSVLTMPEQVPVPVPSNDACDLSGCFATFTSSEFLRVADGDGFLCECCGGDTRHDATKRMVFNELPEVLVVHLKRFSMDRFGRGRKLNKTVHTPKELDMTPFCTEESKNLPGASTAYVLSGIVSHNGSMGGGHYVAIVRRCVEELPEQKQEATEVNVGLGDEKMSDAIHRVCEKDIHQNVKPVTTATALSTESARTVQDAPQNMKWYRVSDSEVQQISEQVALNTQAFLLFYSKKV